jgi:hypothetical protein
LEITSMLPPEWRFDVVSSFLQRAIRRSQHESHTWQILKAISAGENMGISEEYLSAIRDIPPVVQPRPPSPPAQSRTTSTTANSASGVSASEGGMSEKSGSGDGAYSLPNEGSIAEKEYDLGGGAGEKGEGQENQLAVGGGFFSPEIVDKELRNLEVQREENGIEPG